MFGDITELIFKNSHKFLGQKVLCYLEYFFQCANRVTLTINLLLIFPQIQAFDNIKNVKRHNLKQSLKKCFHSFPYPLVYNQHLGHNIFHCQSKNIDITDLE